MNVFHKSVFFLALTLLAARNSFCQENIVAIPVDTAYLPKIESIETRDKDIIFAQFRDALEQNYILLRKEVVPQVEFYLYKAKKGDTVSTLAARFNIIADSFSIINGISAADENLQGATLIIPTVRGLFIPDDTQQTGKESQLEILLQKNRLPLLERDALLWYNIRGRRYAFLPDEKFTPTERAFFLDSTMVMPVMNAVVSSKYGNREDPFGSGMLQMHRGVDLAVPEGSDVCACKGGTVAAFGEDRVYGKWVLLSHSKGMSSFYAHLSGFAQGLKEGDFVRSGDLIAKSGKSGQVTGAHLHFEVRQDGNAVDPKKFLN